MYHILIADKDPDMRQVLTRIIYRFDEEAEILYAKTYDDILSARGEEKIDILFLNLSRRASSYIKAARKLGKEFPDLIICIISVYDESYYGKSLFSMKKIDWYLRKPFSPREIETIFKELKKYSSYVPNARTDELIQKIKSKNFPEAYRCIDGIIREYMDCYIRHSELCDKLLEMAEYLIGKFQGVGQQIMTSKKMWLEPEWCLEKELMKIWLFHVVDDVFQKSSLQQYRILESFYSYIDNHKYEHISLSEIVKECNISQGYLSRIFRSQYDMSVMDYVKLRKIQGVKLKLVISRKNYTTIAEETGFYDGGHMQRIFQKYEGISIQEFKEQLSYNAYQ